ncbi:MAG: hypothetical protein HY544_05120 [Candidatus Diapherotrites archaeon]|uniref:Translation elongation factor EFTu-like domain-containing protein n=1 Tax=Candidatus Iainarchaeum sp. TaxID=3101447 RepID=A0A8T3YRV2_9ARCH|nr:hypothetical protein [Candidatus Diapherotrites archaeon]
MGILGGLFGKEKTAQDEFDAKRQASSADSTAASGFAVVDVTDVYFIAGIGIVPVGNVAEGTLVPGMKCTLNGRQADVKSIEAHHQKLNSAGVGMSIGFVLSGVQKGDVVKGARLRFVV